MNAIHRNKGNFSSFVPSCLYYGSVYRPKKDQRMRNFLVVQDLPRNDDHLRPSSEDQYVPFHPGWWKWNMHATVEKVCCGGTR